MVSKVLRLNVWGEKAVGQDLGDNKFVVTPLHPIRSEQGFDVTGLSSFTSNTDLHYQHFGELWGQYLVVIDLI